jgi:hypothetical protein
MHLLKTLMALLYYTNKITPEELISDKKAASTPLD